MSGGFPWSSINAYKELGWDKDNTPEDASEDLLCEFVANCMETMILRNLNWLASGRVKTTDIREALFKIWRTSPFCGSKLLDTINEEMEKFGFSSYDEHLNKRWTFQDNY